MFPHPVLTAPPEGGVAPAAAPPQPRGGGHLTQAAPRCMHPRRLRMIEQGVTRMRHTRNSGETARRRRTLRRSALPIAFAALATVPVTASAATDTTPPSSITSAPSGATAVAAHPAISWPA